MDNKIAAGEVGSDLKRVTDTLVDAATDTERTVGKNVSCKTCSDKTSLCKTRLCNKSLSQKILWQDMLMQKVLV